MLPEMRGDFFPSSIDMTQFTREFRRPYANSGAFGESQQLAWSSDGRRAPSAVGATASEGTYAVPVESFHLGCGRSVL
jgi:hypothetical protein